MKCKGCFEVIPSEAMLFCPFCGNTIGDTILYLEKDVIKELKEVRVLGQMILSVLPFINFLAAYRIKKLQKYGLIFALSAIGMSLMSYLYYSISMGSYLKDSHPLFGIYASLVYLPLFFTPLPPVQLFFIRKWSIEWNNRLVLFRFIKEQMR